METSSFPVATRKLKDRSQWRRPAPGISTVCPTRRAAKLSSERPAATPVSQTALKGIAARPGGGMVATRGALAAHWRAHRTSPMLGIASLIIVPGSDSKLRKHVHDGWMLQGRGLFKRVLLFLCSCHSGACFRLIARHDRGSPKVNSAASILAQSYKSAGQIVRTSG